MPLCLPSTPFPFSKGPQQTGWIAPLWDYLQQRSLVQTVYLLSQVSLAVCFFPCNLKGKLCYEQGYQKHFWLVFKGQPLQTVIHTSKWQLLSWGQLHLLERLHRSPTVDCGHFLIWVPSHCSSNSTVTAHRLVCVCVPFWRDWSMDRKCWGKRDLPM